MIFHRHALFLLVSVIVSGCGDEFSRSSAQQQLNGDARGSACEASLSFNDGGFDRARAAKAVVSQRKSVNDQLGDLAGGVGSVLFVTTIPNTNDRWLVVTKLFEDPIVRREKKPRECIPGSAEVTLIVDGPASSIKIVEFTETIKLPPELAPIRDYVFLKYRKKALFRKTDKGWLPE